MNHEQNSFDSTAFFEAKLIQSPSNPYKRFGFYEVNLGTFKIEYQGLKMELQWVTKA